MGKLVQVFEDVGCVGVWLQAVDYLLENQTAYNLVLGIEKPDRLSANDYRIQDHLNHFFQRHDGWPISTVATTIFPGSEFLHGSSREVYDEFPKTFAQIREGWGTYAMR